ncbi:MAG: DegT/DnrJ/EryC1/StrS family aminotransferase [gamma proteobacterium symbiont of Taylorina sp.]|nr:DegT/DnrJ/EryC1/StrS family aminotransferase [gamma proteobacterium symbiont of Taylorina sp.]
MKKIFITEPYLSPLEEFIPYLEKIWENKRLTNNGPFHEEFEKNLAQYLGVEYISLFANGTLALVTALQALRISGEVITTPYTFVATAHSLLWNNIKPVFADIEPDTYNIDPRKIEEAITPQTTAILPVHIYGYPCNIEAIQDIADNYGLKVIYDAAHTFGVKHQNQSLCSFGDLSVLSFHATKVFNTFEGGAIICPDLKTKQRIDYLKNFGIADETTVVAPGINGKMNELQAACGVLQLKYIDNQIKKRGLVDSFYREHLDCVRGITCLPLPTGVMYNYSYFPILIEPDYYLERDQLYEKLKANNIFTRRYFYPLVSEYPMYRGLDSASKNNLEFAYKKSRKILCLPIFPSISKEVLATIVSLIKET